MNQNQPENFAAKSAPDVTNVIAIYQPMVRSMTECGSVLCDGYTALGSEWLAFVNRRVHSDLSLPMKLAGCASPQDLLQEWAGFMNTVADDYRKEFARLSAIGSATSQKAVSALQSTNGGIPDRRRQP